jgi:primosomal protein N' (replication factor Y)
MRYAEVSVNSPAAQRRTFTYSLPPGVEVGPGHAVLVPFGRRLLQGVVMDVTDAAAVEEVREVDGAIDHRPMLSPAHIALAEWISRHYLSPLYEAVSLMLPRGFERRTVTYIEPTAVEGPPGRLSATQQAALDLVRDRQRVSLTELQNLLDREAAAAAVTQLVRRGLAARSYGLAAPQVRPRFETFLSLSVGRDKAQEEIARLEKRARKQSAFLAFVAESPGPVSLAEARRVTGCGRETASALKKKGMIAIQEVESRRQPFAHQGISPSRPLRLTPAQETAYQAIRRSVATEGGRDGPAVFVLHGVTGSGKTEVYLQALAEAVRLGKRGIVLVPEISLTPQTVERFASRFPGRVAVLHSQLSTGERFDEWQAIRDGAYDVVIGPRSAVFAPQPDLGLIVLDEEHEWTYKQQDPAPRYHTREAAVRLAGLCGATVVLGSATPDIETYYRAKHGDFRLLELPDRVTPGTGALPSVEVIDLREELRAGNRSIFSHQLHQAIESVLRNGEQAILFLNRRGASSSVQCRSCGHVLGCPNCEIPLSYHSAGDFLLCHQCDYRSQVPRACPRCGSNRIKFLGIGTQKLEQETRQAFPEARLLRWDSDVTRRKHSHQEILDRFRNHEADILIGTQMVAKGLDLPRVTLVGVVIADMGLNLPDFRAGERTFQLLCQVAGRAGRSALGGQVIVQTYSPDHYAIDAAAGHDYARFYEQEISYRRQLHDPPFSQLARLTRHDADDERCRREADRMSRLLNEEMDAAGTSGIDVIGPGPAFIHRLRGQYRWQLVLRGSGLSEFLSRIPVPQGWTVDVDPVGT